MRADTEPRTRLSVADDLVTVVIVDANPLIRLGVTTMLEQTTRLRVVGEAYDAHQAAELVRRIKPQVVVLDLAPPDHANPLRALPELARHAAALVLTSCTDPATVQQAVRAGALGYLIHGQFGAAELILAVERAALGQTLLSPAAVDALISLVRTHPEPVPRRRGSSTSPNGRLRS